MMNDEQTALNTMTLAEAVEARRQLGTFTPIRNIQASWMDRRCTVAQIRLLRAHIPLAEELPTDEFEEGHALVFKEVGAPCLMELTVRNDSLQIMEAFHSLVSLEDLGLVLPFSPASYDPFTSLIQRYKRSLLPKLKRLRLCSSRTDDNDDGGGYGAKRFFEAIGDHEALATVEDCTLV